MSPPQVAQHRVMIDALTYDYALSHDYVLSDQLINQTADNLPLKQTESDTIPKQFKSMFVTNQALFQSLSQHSIVSLSDDAIRSPLFSLLTKPRTINAYKFNKNMLVIDPVKASDINEYYTINQASYVIPESYDVNINLYHKTDLKPTVSDTDIANAYQQDNMWLQPLKSTITVRPINEATSEESSAIFTQLVQEINNQMLQEAHDGKTKKALAQLNHDFTKLMQNKNGFVATRIDDDNAKTSIHLSSQLDSNTLSIDWFHTVSGKKEPLKNNARLKDTIHQWVVQQKRNEQWLAFTDQLNEARTQNSAKLPSDLELEPVSKTLLNLNKNSIRQVTFKDIGIDGDGLGPNDLVSLHQDFNSQLITNHLNDLNSVPLNLGDDYLLIYRITKTHPQKQQTLEDVSNDIRKLLTKHREKAAYDSAVAELTHQLKSDSNSEHDSFTKSEQNIQFNASWLEQDGFSSPYSQVPDYWSLDIHELTFKASNTNADFADLVFIKNIDLEHTLDNDIPPYFETKQSIVGNYVKGILLSNPLTSSQT